MAIILAIGFALPAAAAPGDNCSRPEDANCDGSVDGLDILVVVNSANWQRSDPRDARSDVSGDGNVDGLDIGAIGSVYQCSASAFPVADGGADQTAFTGDTLSFDGSASSDDVGPIMSYAWDFGNGSIATTAHADHAYASAGTYAVTLTVTNKCGNSDVDTIIVDVEDESDPDEVTADFSINPNPAEVMVPVTFTASAPANQVKYYMWSFSGGSAAGGSGGTVSRTFNYAGSYTATLKVVPKSGPMLTKTQSVTVSPGLMLLDIVESEMVNLPRGFAVTNDAVWAAGSDSAIATADLADPGNPVLLAEATLVGAPWHMDADESLVAVAANWGGLYLFDATQPEYLTPLGRYDTFAEDGTSIQHVALVGNLVYAACGDKLLIFDVSDPSNPTKAATWTGSGQIMRADYINDHLFVYDFAIRGYRVLDVEENPLAPVQVGSFGTTGIPGGVAVSGNLVAMAEAQYGLEVFDVSNLAAPVRLVRRTYTGSGPLGAAFRGQFLYVSNVSRIEKLNMANPASPTLVQSVPVGLLTFEVRAHGNYLLSAVQQGVAAVLRP